VGGGGVASESGGGLMEAVTAALGVDVRVVGCRAAPLSFSDYRGGSGGGGRRLGPAVGDGATGWQGGGGACLSRGWLAGGGRG
jgi:hypothetical protein